MGFKSLNDSNTKFHIDSRKSFIENKKNKGKINNELYQKANNYINQQEIFDIIECVECKEIIDVTTDTEYVQMMKKLVEVAQIETEKKQSKKDKEKEMFLNGGLSVNRTRSGKIIKRTVEDKEVESHIDNIDEPKKKQKRTISEEVREARRQRMKAMWEKRKQEKNKSM
jgi:hypothetical protein